MEQKTIKSGFLLNLPKADIPLKQIDSQLHIWDSIRRRWVVLTPEEWVRQHFTAWMTGQLGYPSARLAHEVSLSLGGLHKRCDAVFYDQHGKPQIILEFKAPHIQITQKTFDQICRYNMAMQVPLLIVSNGITHYCCRILENKNEDKKVEFLREIPPYNDYQ